MSPEPEQEQEQEEQEQQAPLELQRSSSSAATSQHEQGGSTPVHPVASMRAAFAESIAESESGSDAGRRRRTPRHHRLRKLVAQLAFGLYLLHENIARSEPTVVRILQTHINDLDHFLSATGSQLALADSDIGTRLAHLQLPLTAAAGGTFDAMLLSREFRREMIARNEAVEYVATRTGAALRRAHADVQQGLAAVDELAAYILQLHAGWRTPALQRVYAAMRHNAEMWARAGAALLRRCEALATVLAELQAVVEEIYRRSGVASRIDKPPPLSIPARSHLPQPAAQIDKPLPSTPSQPLCLAPPPRTSSLARPPRQVAIDRVVSSESDHHPKRRLSKRTRSQILTPTTPRPDEQQPLRRRATMMSLFSNAGSRMRRASVPEFVHIARAGFSPRVAGCGADGW
ncbi:hypothetical protein EDC01DRAFT_630283 [Geopyxis carbonaria]|nr:hypothetical protein EDC01DRAFT_630283 [Geopyxis carbonaria]